MIVAVRAPLACAVLAAVLAGCGARQAGPAASAGREDPPPTAESGGYAAPPAPLAARRDAHGIALRGRAAPGARVSLASPDGWSTQGSADAKGLWVAQLPAAPEPRLYALTAQAGGRALRAEGAVMTLPGSGPAALMVRAGYAALPLPARVGKPLIVSVDFDPVGSTAVGGLAAPDDRMQLSVDGQPADVDIADFGGRFALMGPRNRPLGFGPHSFLVASRRGEDQVRITLSPPAPFQGRALQASHTPGGWRVDWAVPGGGVQTTLVLDRSDAAR